MLNLGLLLQVLYSLYIQQCGRTAWVCFIAIPYSGAPRLVFQGVEVPEHSLVVREAIGTFNDGTLMCVTDYRPCCVADIRSTWMWPSGRVVPYHPNARGIGVVRLHRNTLGASGKGIMMCRIRVSAGDGSQNFKFLLVGVYSRIQHIDSTPEDGEYFGVATILTCVLTLYSP